MDSKTKADITYAIMFVVGLAIIVAGILAFAYMSIEAGKYHHDTRVENVSTLLAGYEDCKVISVADEEYIAHTVTLECVK